jgi:hypothetical protein
VPVWIVTAWVGAGLPRLERARYRLLLGVDIEVPPMPSADRNPIRYAGVLWRDPGVRRRTLYQVLAGPVGLLTAGSTYLLLSGSLALLAMPLLGWMVPDGDGITFGIPFADSDGGRTLLAGLGLVLLRAAPGALRGLAALDIALARALLGPPPAVLARRVDELERSRARVVDAGEAERRRPRPGSRSGSPRRWSSARARSRSTSAGSSASSRSPRRPPTTGACSPCCDSWRTDR